MPANLTELADPYVRQPIDFLSHMSPRVTLVRTLVLVVITGDRYRMTMNSHVANSTETAIFFEQQRTAANNRVADPLSASQYKIKLRIFGFPFPPRRSQRTNPTFLEQRRHWLHPLITLSDSSRMQGRSI